MGEFSCIVLDLEWNQPLDAGGAIREPFFFDSEIIEIGALKLNAQLEVVDEFKTFIRPVFYPVMNGDVVRLTKIRPQELEGAPDFPAAYRAFRDWCGEECCLCAWGTDDIPVLLDNLIMHGLETEDFPCYDLQRIFGHEVLREERQCSLERAMELLGIRPDRAHDALNDARNTVRVMERMDLAARRPDGGACGREGIPRPRRGAGRPGDGAVRLPLLRRDGGSARVDAAQQLHAPRVRAVQRGGRVLRVTAPRARRGRRAREPHGL